LIRHSSGPEAIISILKQARSSARSAVEIAETIQGNAGWTYSALHPRLVRLHIQTISNLAKAAEDILGGLAGFPEPEIDHMADEVPQ